MLQMFQSSDIINKIEKDFSLYEHYEINPEDQYAYTYLLNKINENISFRKTEYESIEIKVLDTDPFIASNMVDSLISYVNNKVIELHRIKYKEVIHISKGHLSEKKNSVSSLEKEIVELRTKYGLLDFDIQAEELTKGQVKVLSEGRSNQPQSREILTLIENLKTKGEELRGLDYKLGHERNRVDSLTKIYEAAISGYEKNITYAQVVSSPYAADKKSYPVRWIIVLLSTISAMFLSVIVIGIIESKKQ